MCDVPCNYITGIILPWTLGAIVNHLQIFLYLVNWTALGTSIIVQFVCPIFMWSKSIKEADMYEQNFKQSLQMILEIEKDSPKKLQEALVPAAQRRDDGVPSIDNSSVR